MVAYNFKKQFIKPILAGEKRATVRKNGKRPHAKVGQALQLYYGLRTSQVRKIADAVCTLAIPIEVDVTEEEITAIRLGGLPVDDMEQFATSDGFESLAQMHSFWLDMHGVGTFFGTLIGWESLDVKR